MSEKFCKRAGWGLFLGGVVILILTAASNYFRGDLLGVSQAGKWIGSIGSMSIDIVGIVGCGLAAGACWASRRWGWASILTLALLLSVVWSANSILSFQAAERISATKTRAAEIDRSKDADKLTRDSVGKTLDAAKHAETRSARKDFIGATQETIKAFRESKVKVTVEPDAGAAWWASLIGWKLETVQLTEATYFALLLIFLKSVCFAASGFFFSWSPEPASRTISGSSQGSGGGVKTSETPKDKLPENVRPIRAQVPVRSAEFGAPSPYLKTSPRERVNEALRRSDGPFSSLTALSVASGASLATTSRAVRDLAGKGKLQKGRKGRSLQISKTYGGGHPAFGH